MQKQETDWRNLPYRLIKGMVYQQTVHTQTTYTNPEVAGRNGVTGKPQAGPIAILIFSIVIVFLKYLVCF